MQVWWHRAEECPRRGWRARRRRAPAQGPAAPCGAGDGGDRGGDERRAGAGGVNGGAEGRRLVKENPTELVLRTNLKY